MLSGAHLCNAQTSHLGRLQTIAKVNRVSDFGEITKSGQVRCNPYFCRNSVTRPRFRGEPTYRDDQVNLRVDD